MIKPVVGKVKSPSYALPDDDFVYGIESKMDDENAGEGEEGEMNHILHHSVGGSKQNTNTLFVFSLEMNRGPQVVQSWAQSRSSEPSSMQSFPATTRMALKNGCLTSKSQREYCKMFPVMKHSLESSSQHNNANKNGELLDNTTLRDGSSASSDQQQPQVIFGISGKQRRKGRVPPARATKSSLSVAACREPPSEEEMAKKKSVEEFKLTKFKNVESKVKRYM